MKRIIIAAILVSLAIPSTAYADGCRRHYVAYLDDMQQEQQAQATISANKFKFDGTAQHDGVLFTWYSEKVLPGEGLVELNANGRTVNDDGYVVDADGFIAVASPWGIDPIGTVIETPFGMAKVYDVCEDDSYDVYTSW